MAEVAGAPPVEPTSTSQGGADESTASSSEPGATPPPASPRPAKPPSRRCRCTVRAAAPAAAPGGLAALRRQRAQARVGCDSTAEHQVADLELAARRHRLGRQHIDDRLLEGRCYCGHIDPVPGCLPLLHPARDRRLQPREREVPAMLLLVLRRGEATWEGNGVRRAHTGHPVDLRTAGEGQTQQSGDLVERLSGGIVQRGAERGDVASDVLHPQQVWCPPLTSSEIIGAGSSPCSNRSTAT